MRKVSGSRSAGVQEKKEKKKKRNTEPGEYGGEKGEEWSKGKKRRGKKTARSEIDIDFKYILLHVLLCSIAEYFYELCRILASP